MEISEAQYERIAPYLPVQRGSVRLSNLQVGNAILYVAEQGCKWRDWPPRCGNWHTIYMWMKRWSKNGVLDRVFEQLQREQIVHIKVEGVSMDSTTVRVHPVGAGALRNGPQSIGKSRGGWTTKIRMVAADGRTAMTFSLSPGQPRDAPEGRKLPKRIAPPRRNPSLLMDRAYESNVTRQLALALGFTPECLRKFRVLTSGSMTGRCTRGATR